ncbi:MAG: aminotransferase [Verrucomicrobia bacterium]|nr:MAG: aminotransferase [Verrucomicrobiota bacterium]
MSLHLYIPGPVQVSERTLQAMTQPPVGHRSPDFVSLYQSIQPRLQDLFYTTGPVFLSTSSAWGVMEGCVRNLTRKRVLNCMNGAFSDKWHDVSLRCGLEATALQFDWGQPVDPEALRRELATGAYDVVTLVHNETSTGTMSPLDDLAAVLREFPDVISVVDAVSSFSALAIEKDRLGIDVLLTGAQKALALPPGMALFSASDRAFERAAKVKTRGYYFDFHEFLRNHEKGMTPSTPVISLIYALRSKLDDIFSEGLEARYARHARLNAKVHGWVERNGFSLLPRKEFASVTLSCVENTLGIDVPAFNQVLKDRFSCVIDGGYGKLKGKTFRISNMGDETDASIDALVGYLDAALEESGTAKA